MMLRCSSLEAAKGNFFFFVFIRSSVNLLYKNVLVFTLIHHSSVCLVEFCLHKLDLQNR